MGAIKTHCKRGHERTPENINESRDCKICADARVHARLAINIRAAKLRQHGWSLESFAAAKEFQGGRCAICRVVPEPLPRYPEGLYADHEHVKPPKPRALLCNACNTAIGMLKENPAFCDAAAAYLRYWATQ